MKTLKQLAVASIFISLCSTIILGLFCLAYENDWDIHVRGAYNSAVYGQQYIAKPSTDPNPQGVQIDEMVRNPL